MDAPINCGQFSKNKELQRQSERGKVKEKTNEREYIKSLPPELLSLKEKACDILHISYFHQMPWKDNRQLIDPSSGVDLTYMTWTRVWLKFELNLTNQRKTCNLTWHVLPFTKVDFINNERNACCLVLHCYHQWHRWATVLHWVTFFIKVNMGNVVYFELNPHRCRKHSTWVYYYGAAQNSPQQMHYLLLFEWHFLKTTAPSRVFNKTQRPQTGQESQKADRNILGFVLFMGFIASKKTKEWHQPLAVTLSKNLWMRKPLEKNYEWKICTIWT